MFRNILRLRFTALISLALFPFVLLAVPSKFDTVSADSANVWTNAAVTSDMTASPPVLARRPFKDTSFVDTLLSGVSMLPMFAIVTEQFTGANDFTGPGQHTYGLISTTFNRFNNQLEANGSLDFTENIALASGNTFTVQSLQIQRFGVNGNDAKWVRIEGRNPANAIIYTNDVDTSANTLLTININSTVKRLDFTPITVTGNGQHFVGQGSLRHHIDNMVYDNAPPGNTAPNITGVFSAQARAFNELGGIYPFSDPSVGVNANIQDSENDTLIVDVYMDDPSRGLLTSGYIEDPPGNPIYFTTVGPCCAHLQFTGSPANATTLIRTFNLILSNVDDKVDTGQVYKTTFTITAKDPTHPLVTNTDAQALITGVNEPPTITAAAGTLTNQFTYDRDTVAPFALLTIDDPDNKVVTNPDVLPETLTVDVTFPDVQGTLVGAGWSKFKVQGGTATWRHLGNYQSSTTAIQTVQFNPTDGFTPGQVVNTAFTVKATDQGNLSVTFGSAISVNAKTNTSPTISGPSPITNGIVLEDVSTAGVTVLSFVQAPHPMSDVDVDQRKGVAIIASNAPFQYSTDGTNWTNFGAVSAASALVLSDTTQIRLGASNANGTLSFTYKAWDRSSWLTNVGGTASSFNTRVLVDASGFSTPPTNVSPFSLANIANNQPVTPVNDAPVATGSSTLATVAEDTANPPGATVTSLYLARFDDSADNQTATGGSSANLLAGIAITGNAATAGQGTWQYFSGGSWQPVGARTSATALLVATGDSLRFLPALNFNGSPGVLSARLVDDSGGAVSSGTVVDLSMAVSTGGTTRYSVAGVNLSTTISPVNDAPVDVVPGAQTTSEDTAKVFSSGGGNQIASSDVDDADNGVAGDETIQVTLTATNGTITLSGIGGLSFNSGANGTAAMTVSGSMGSVNAAMNGMSYLPTLNFNGSSTITITTNDLMNFGSGGPLTDTDIVGITVTAVNDAPINTLPAPQTTNEETAKVFNLSVSDVDDADNAIAGDETLQETLTAANGTLTLSGVAGLTFTGGANGSATMTFSGTRNAVNAAMTGLSFTPSANFTGPTTVTITTSDLGNFGAGGILTDTDALNFTVTPVNDAPVNTVPGVQSTSEETPRIFSAANGNAISVADVDDADNGTAGDEPVQVTLSGTSGTITLGSTAGLAFSVGDGTADATMTFSGTINSVVVAMNGMGFTPSLNFVGTGVVSITTSDLGNFGSGGPLTDTDTVNVTVTGVNDAPVNTVPAPQTASEEVAFAFSQANGNRIAVGDVDDADDAIVGNESMQTTLTAANGTITLASTVGLTFNAGANGSSALTFTGTITDINGAMNGMSLTSSPNFTGATSVTITTNDLGNFGAGGPLTDTDTVNVTVNGVNDAPVNTVPGVQSTSEETARIFSAANANAISVADIDDADNGTAGDEIVRVTLSGTNGTITLGGIAGLTFTTGDGTADATMTFNGTINSVNAAINGMGFTPSLNFVGTGVVSITTNDLGNFGSGGPLTDTDTVNVTVTGVNDAPVNTVPAPQTASEEVAFVFAQANGNRIAVGDVDDADNGIAGDESMRTTLTAANGTITLASTVGLTFNAGANGTSALTFTGTITDINSAMNGMSLTSSPNFTGATSISITTNDLGNFGAGGPLTDTDTVNVTVSGVNDAPVNTIPGVQTTDENTPKAFTVSVADVDDADNGTAGDETVRETLTAANGTLTLSTLSGLSFTAGDGTADTTMTFSGTINSVNAAMNGMTFTPAFGFSGPTTVTVTTNDLGNFGTGGPLTDTDNVNFTVTSVNNAPVNIVPAPQTTNEETALVFSLANANRISISDADDADNAIVGDETLQVTLTSANGPITLAGIAGLTFNSGANATTAMTFTGTLAAINTSMDGMSLTPPLNFTGATTLTITTNDLGNFGPGGPLSDTDIVNVNVSPVNDAPVNTVPAAQVTNEETTRVFSAANGNQISTGDVDDADNAINGDEPVQVTLTATGGVVSLSGVAGLSFSFTDANGTGAGDGTADATMTFRGTIASVNTALAGESYLPNVNFNGAGSLTITTKDLGNFGSGGVLIDTDSVNIAVNQVNDAPVNTVPGTQTINEEAVLTFTGGNGNLIAINDVDDADNAVNGDEPVQVTLAAANGTLTLSGVAGLSFAFSDVNGTGAGDGTADATMTFRGTIAGINTAMSGMTFTPTVDFSGSTTLSITTKDLGNFGTGGVLSDTDSVNITVSPINDAPTFTKGPNQTLVVNQGAISVPNWVAAMSPGPANEAGQTLSFQITGNTNAALFSTPPAVSPAGTLTFQSTPYAIGSANITLVIKDNGGTASGGVDTSAPQTFTITVNQGTTGTVVNSSPNPSALNVPVTFTATVTAVAPSTGPPQGTVEFREGATLLGTGSLNGSGVASYTTNSLTTGSHTITALYLATTAFASSSGNVIQVVDLPPTAVGSALNVLSAGATTHSVTVCYSDDIGINAGTIDSNDIRVTGPNGFNVPTTYQNGPGNVICPQKAATYTFTTPGGTWDSADNGTYNIVMQANQVTDTANQPVPPGTIGTFTVNVPAISITGNIQQYVSGGPNTNLAGVTVSLSSNNAPIPPGVLTDANGNFSFANLQTGGNYVVTPTLASKVLDPFNRTYNNISSNKSANFVAYNTGAVPRIFSIPTSFVKPGQNVSIPIVVESQGTEAYMAFSVAYDPSLFNNPVATCGSATAGCGVGFSNPSAGVVGITITPTAVLTAGSREIALLTLTSLATNVASTSINFTDNPTVRLVRNATNDPLPATYTNGTTMFSLGFEADLACAAACTTGDGQLLSNDVTKIRQMAVGSLVPNDEFNEFQRADSAPRATGGDGQINAADTIQTRRYTAGLDPQQIAAGPGGPAPQLELPGGARAETETSRAIGIASGTSSPGGRTTVSIEMNGSGIEAAAGFTLSFDPTKLSNPTVSLGSGLPASAVLTTNLKNAGNGKIGVLVDSGEAFVGSQVVTVTFDVAANAAGGETPIAFTSTLAAQGTSDAEGNALPAKYTDGNVTISGPASAAYEVMGRVLMSDGRGLRNTTVTLTDASGNARNAVTGSLGYYAFNNLAGGETYVLTVESKRYHFESRTIRVESNMASVDLIAP